MNTNKISNQKEELLHLIKIAWEQSPELRLMQLFVATIKPTEPCPQVFYFENEELIKRLARTNSNDK